MKISVIIPSYKPQDYLWECLDSLYNQTLCKEDYELILVLNGCKDPYERQIKDYLSLHKDLRVNFIQTDIGGVSNARNIALKKAHGDYIAFIDDDDYVSSSYLEELYKKASRDIVALCYPLSFISGSNDFEPYYITSDYIRNANRELCSIMSAKRYFSGPVYKLIHRDIIKDRIFDIRFENGEDSIFMFLISDKINKVSFTTTDAIYYRRLREGSAMTKKKSGFSIISNCFNMIKVYSSIYFRHPFSYNFMFYTTRVLAAIHGAIEQFSIKKS